jgi:ribosomal protein S18 acetylase RimI-like enzyme
MECNEISISRLRDVPQFLDAVIDQNFTSWGEITNLDRGEMEALFRTEMSGDDLPATFVAHRGERYAGCVSLRQKTMGSIKHPDLYGTGSPWLSNMWVAQWARGRGVATKLTEELEAAATRAGTRRIYSSTAERNSLYHKMGYVTVKQKRFREFTVFLIVKDL